ncbi:MAG: DEAD/DEAH box helicase [Polyangiaceae bacterium]|nr:DEAD/DEAH box helicase [Polyangiaceae bacterium]
MTTPSPRGAAQVHELVQTIAGLPNDQAILAALLALQGELRISHWTEQASWAGLREAPTRKHSTTSLRTLVKELEAAGLIVENEGTFRCRLGRRALILRHAGTQPWFDRVCSAGATGSPEHDLIVAMAARPEEVEVWLERLIQDDPDRRTNIVAELLEPYDPAWMARLSPAAVARLDEVALLAIERNGSPMLGPYAFCAADLTRVGALTAAAASAFAGIAVLRGDRETLRALSARASSGEAADRAEVALAMIEGRAAEAGVAAAALPDPKRGAHAGVLFALATLALRAHDPGSPRVAKWVAFGAAKSAPFCQSFRVLEAALRDDVEQLTRGPRYERNRSGDTLSLLFQGLRFFDPILHSYDLSTFIPAMVEDGAHHARLGTAWLGEQLELCAWRMQEAFGAGLLKNLRAHAVPPKPGHAPFILDARSTRPEWELKLERLEALAGGVPGEASLGGAAPPSSEERIVWRAQGVSLWLEPHLQKRGAKGEWTAGRKLAIKHLVGKTELTARLPPEDARVAAHAIETRSSYGGYPTYEHSLTQAAWLALAGHPRVYLRSEEEPRQVVPGESRLRVRSKAERIVVSVVPPGLGPGIHVREEGRQLVVYDVPKSQKGILDLIGPELEVPVAGRDRLLAAMARLAPLMPVESTETLSARAVPARATPAVRLTPSRGGLSVAIVVRPLGQGSLLLSPGSGEKTLVGHLDGQVVQTERDLELEERLAERVVEACPLLRGGETGRFSYRLDEPEDCLELVAALRELGDAIAVEWPQGAPLKLRARVSRRAFRGRLSLKGPSFTLDAALAVDDGLTLELEPLFDLLAQHPGRFVQLASGEYIELEQGLRDVLDGLRAARAERAHGARGVAIPRTALPVLDALTDQGSALALDAPSAAWRARVDEVFAKTPAIPRALQATLRDYQVGGYRWLARLTDLGFGACLADDMGLGKTIQIIALLLQRASRGPALVVAPTSVCEGWRRETERFAPSLDARVYGGPERADSLLALKRRDVVIVSYALLQQDAAALAGVAWATAVLDEAQLIKNPETLRAKAAFGLQAEARVVATGTPVENHAGDLHSLFQFLNPGLLGSPKAFAASLDEQGRLGRATKRLVAPFILRRTKAQVLEDLPPITDIQRTVLLSPGEAKLYESIRKAALDKLARTARTGRDHVQILAELTRLRRLCCHPQLVVPEASLTSSKLESLLELLIELTEAGHRVLVFSQFTDVLALIRPLLDAKGIPYQYLDGKCSPKQRSAAVDAFQEGVGDVFLISLKAGGFGLNLTAADYVVHVDPWWNPAVEAQATDRAHRIGQTRPVTVYRLVTAGTIEARIVELHRDKRDLADAVLSDTDRAAKLTADDLRGLLEA